MHYLQDGPGIELGYQLAPAYWGHGLAAEAAQACLNWALPERPERVVAIVDPASTRSARVLSKIGMVRDGTFSRSGHTWDFYVAIRRQITLGGTQGPAARAAAWQNRGLIPGSPRSPVPSPLRFPPGERSRAERTGGRGPGVLRRLLLAGHGTLASRPPGGRTP